jgi:hypothetical protein
VTETAGANGFSLTSEKIDGLRAATEPKSGTVVPFTRPNAVGKS